MADAGYLNDHYRHEDSQGNIYYHHPEDEDKKRKTRYAGVTSIISAAWPSHYLEKWRMGNLAKYLIDNEKIVTKKLKHSSNKSEPFRELGVKSLQEKLIGWSQDFSAADRGTRIHLVLEEIYKNKTSVAELRKLAHSDYEVAVAVRAARLLKDKGFKILATEIKVYGKAICGQRYAGTVDIVAEDKDGYLAVIDLKTGKRVNKAYIPQLGAYAYAETMIHPETKKVIFMPYIRNGHVLHATSKKAELYSVDIEDAKELFDSCALIYQTANTSGGLTKWK